MHRNTLLPGATFHLVGNQNDRAIGFSQNLRKCAVIGQNACTAVDQKQTHIRLGNCGARLLPHTPLQAVFVCLFKTGSIYHLKFELTNRGVGKSAVTGYTRCIVNKRKLLANQPVEQCRFAHIGPTNNGDGKAHFLCPTVLPLVSSCLLART